MRALIRFFVRNSLFGDLLTFAVIAMGAISLFTIRREVFPNVNFDIITISTLFPGSSAEETERLVTSPIEQDLLEVEGVKKMISYSVDSLSTIYITLDPDQTNADKSKADVQDVIDRLNTLPAEIDDPVVTSLESKQAPLIEIHLSGNVPELELREHAKKLERQIKRIPGVARIIAVGLRDKEIHVEVSQTKLREYQLSLEDVIQSIRAQNVSIPGGTVEPVEGAATERLIRTMGEYQNLEDVEKTVVRANDLVRSISLKDIAKVTYGLERSSTALRSDQKPSISLTILKKEKADAIDLVARLKQRMKDIASFLPPEIHVNYVHDMSEYIERRLSILTGNLLLGLLFVLLLLPIMIPMRFALIVALGEPFAFLGSILLLATMGYSINLISMIGLIIVSGILVDDSIVVTENAVRLIEEEGMDPEEAAIEGTLQIVGPVTASVCTTALAFIPMLFMSGIFGKFTREIPIAVLTCLAVSLFETYFILPAHVAHWIEKKSQRKKIASPSLISRFLEASRTFWTEQVEPRYERFLEKALRWRYFVLLGVFALFVGTIVMATSVMRLVLFPPEGIEIFFLRADAPHGTSLEQTLALIRPVEKQIVDSLAKEELKNIVTVVGLQQQDPHDPNTKRGSEYAQIVIFLTPEELRHREAKVIIDELRAKVGHPTGFERVHFDRVNPGPPLGKPVSIGVRAEKFDDILPAVRDIQERLKKVDGVTDIADNYILGKEEWRIYVDPAHSASAKLSTAAVGMTLRAAYEGVIASSVKNLTEEVDVRVFLPRNERGSDEALRKMTVPNAFGNLIPVDQVSDIRKDQGLAVYAHEDNERQVKVTADVDVRKISAIEANNLIRDVLPELRAKYPQVGIDFGGEDEDTQESLASLFRAFGAAIIGIFLILVLTFKGLVQPFVILLTIPLGFIAVIWTFILHGQPISFMGCLGIIALAGIIVNNAIVFVDFVNQRRLAGDDRWVSIRMAARTRLRPIFLTTITTIVGVLPTAYGIGGLDKFVVPIALALGWGLFFGSVLTSFVFPSALAVMDDFVFWGQARWPGLFNFYSSQGQTHD